MLGGIDPDGPRSSRLWLRATKQRPDLGSGVGAMGGWKATVQHHKHDEQFQGLEGRVWGQAWEL